MNNNKYYVFITGWMGMNINDINTMKPNSIFNNKEDAINEINRLWKEELEPDDGVYIYHNGILEEF